MKIGKAGHSVVRFFMTKSHFVRIIPGMGWICHLPFREIFVYETVFVPIYTLIFHAFCGKLLCNLLHIFFTFDIVSNCFRIGVVFLSVLIYCQ